MQINWRSSITAGILASIAIVLFMNIIPGLMGMGRIDIIRELGNAFNASSPYVAGSVCLAVLGIIWASVFSVLYNSLPGNYLTKGAVYGVIVGLFSLAILPNIMSTVDGLFGAPNEYSVVRFALNPQAIVTIVAYVVYGVTLAITNRPAEGTSRA